ncbi:hypothetical protein [Nitrosomonas communis]|uniref:hypothetical protein n=1 Tax=Nitrosomonas communis TaxID=44574 RepID=UPI003D26C2F8
MHRLNLTHVRLLVRKASYADKVIQGLAKGDIRNVLSGMLLSMLEAENLSLCSRRMVLG